MWNRYDLFFNTWPSQMKCCAVPVCSPAEKDGKIFFLTLLEGVGGFMLSRFVSLSFGVEVITVSCSLPIDEGRGVEATEES